MVVPTRGMNHYLQNLAYRALIGTAMSLPYARRVPFAGRAVSHIAGAAGWRKRIRDNPAPVSPEEAGTTDRGNRPRGAGRRRAHVDRNLVAAGVPRAGRP